MATKDPAHKPPTGGERKANVISRVVVSVVVVGILYFGFGGTLPCLSCPSFDHINTCEELKTAMRTAIGESKGSSLWGGIKDPGWHGIREAIERRHDDLSCDFDTYDMYTIPGEL